MCRSHFFSASCIVVLAGWLAFLGPSGALSLLAASAAPQTSTSASSESHRALLGAYCISCHNQRLRTGGIAFDTMDLGNIAADGEVWEKVIRKLRMRAMPPPGRPRPDETTYTTTISFLETELERGAETRPNPGRTESFHRLNRSEYRNAVRDLLALDVDISSLLPADDATHGLDNMADVLSLSPALLERYLLAARKLSRLAIGIAPRGPAVETYRVPRKLAQDDQMSEELPFGSRGGVALDHYFPVDGEYVVKVALRRVVDDYIIGLAAPQTLEIRLDRRRLNTFTIGGEDQGTPAPHGLGGSVSGDPAWEHYAHHADEGLQVRFFSTAGPRTISVSFRSTLAEAEGVLQPVPADSSIDVGNSTTMEQGRQAVEIVSIDGPYNMAGPGDTPSRRKVLVCRPAALRDEAACARTILSALARRAFHRPVTPREVDTLLEFYRAGRKNGGFEDPR